MIECWRCLFMARLKTKYLFLLFVALYLSTCYYVYRAVDTQVARSDEYQRWKQNAKQNEWPVLSIRKNENGSWQFLQEVCPVHIAVKHSHLSPHFSPVNIISLVEGTCAARQDPVYHLNDSFVVMEELWQSINVNYPQYVYTVSGWIQVIDVPSYVAKPALRVIIVPHSHQDIGWRETADSCYASYAKGTLETAIQKLAEHKDWKFIWAEIAFLSRWYKDASDEKKKSLKRAITSGQLEIVTGGWVMTEEACAHFAPMLNQLTEGHLWLEQELGVRPNVSWSVDPFGHSPTMAYLLGGSGIRHLVIQRIHYAVKRHLAKAQHLEFDWRQSWDDKGSTDVSCHMMPFLLYAIPFSCGPDPHICCQFDFSRKKCFHGTKIIPTEPITKENIKNKAWALWEQYQKKSQLYKGNIILVPHGDDFRYDSAPEWDTQFGNLRKLMDYMNADRDMNIKVEFGTISDYFKAVMAERNEAKSNDVSAALHLPKLVGDFFPYNDRDDQYWTGFYSSRPFYKYMARVLQARLRSTEIVYTLIFAQLLYQKKEDLIIILQNSYHILQEARRDEATFMHHDAITGTSKKKVVKDYANMLHRSVNKLANLFHLLLSVMLTGNSRAQKYLKMNEQWTSSTLPPKQPEAELATRTIMVTNPLTTDRVYVIRIRVLDPNMRVLDAKGRLLRQQVNPVWDEKLIMLENAVEIAFEAEVPALSMKTYTLEMLRSFSSEYASVTLHGMDTDSFNKPLNQNAMPFSINKSSEETFSIENGMITATFSSCTGTMQHIMRKSDDHGHKVRVQFMTYSTGSWSNPFKDKSGAYIFMPDGPAKDLEVKYPRMVVVRGDLVTSVYTYFTGVTHVTTLYNVTGPVGAGIHIDNTVDLDSASWDNKEMVMRIVSDLHNPHSDVCVDQNGFQLVLVTATYCPFDERESKIDKSASDLQKIYQNLWMTRKQWRAKQLIQGNFHPVNTMAFIEDDHRSRLTLIMAQAHGLASLNYGWLEVVLDRRLMQDDWRGLGEGVYDNVPTPSKFVLLLENRDTPVVKTRHTSTLCRPSMLAELTSEHLNNPPVVTLSHLEISTLANHGVHSMLEGQLPCSLNLVNLKMVQMTADLRMTALMVVHHPGVDCDFSEVHMICRMKGTLQMNLFKGTKVWQATETSLTSTHEKRQHSLREAEVPEMELGTYKVIFF